MLLPRGGGGQMILIPKNSCCRQSLHQFMSSAAFADNLCFTSGTLLSLKPLWNLYRDTRWDRPSGTTRQTWLRVLIMTSVSFSVNPFDDGLNAMVQKYFDNSISHSTKNSWRRSFKIKHMVQVDTIFEHDSKERPGRGMHRNIVESSINIRNSCFCDMWSIGN